MIEQIIGLAVMSIFGAGAIKHEAEKRRFNGTAKGDEKTTFVYQEILNEKPDKK